MGANSRLGAYSNKYGNTTNKNDNYTLIETTKKEIQMQSRIGEDIDEKSTTQTIKQAIQWPTSVALNTHS